MLRAEPGLQGCCHMFSSVEQSTASLHNIKYFDSVHYRAGWNIAIDYCAIMKVSVQWS
jgi:hypothetical protein